MRGKRKKDPAKILKGMAKDVMRDMPNTAGYLAASNTIDTDTSERIASGFSDIAKWLDTRNVLGGVPGQLNVARYKADDIPDPVIRDQAHRFYDALQRLSPEEQQAFMNFASAARQDITPTVGAPTGSDEAVELVRATGGEAEVSGDTLILAGETASIDIKATLDTLFPDLKVEIGDELYESEYFDDVVNSTGDFYADWAWKNSRGTRAAVNALDDYQKGKGSLFDAARGFGAGAVQVGFDFTTSAVGTGARTVGAEGIAEDVSGVAKELESDIGKAVTPILSLGLDKNDPDYQEKLQARSEWFIIGTAVLGVAGGAVGRRLKITRSAIGVEGATAALAATRSIKRGGPLGVGAEAVKLPIREITKAVDDQLVRFARDPEAFFTEGIRGRQGKKLVATVNAARKAHPDKLDGQVGFVVEAYGSQLPDKLIRNMLRETTDEGAQRAFVDFLTSPDVSQAARTTLRARKNLLTRKLREIEDSISKRGSGLDDGPGETDQIMRELDDVRGFIREEEAAGSSGAPLNQARGRAKELSDRLKAIEVERKSYTSRRLELLEVDNRLRNAPTTEAVMRYPRRNDIRAALRAPASNFERGIYAFSQLPVVGAFNPLKLVDELGRFPTLSVPGSLDAPSDAIAQNADIVSNYMRRAGVKNKVIQERLGELARTTNSQEFYDIVFKRIFGGGGDIDQALPKNIDAQLRRRIVEVGTGNLDQRTHSVINDSVDTPAGKRRVTEPVLGRDDGTGDATPLPSRPSEELGTVTLPDVERVIEANSALQRWARGVQQKNFAGKAAAVPYFGAKYLLGFGTAILKPSVMLVRLPAMAMRIQLEQALRISNLGYRPFKGIPKGITLFPGGIPVPMSPKSTRVLQGLFGEDGWKLLAPDPRAKGFSDPLPNELGAFSSEMLEREPMDSQRVTTAEFRSGSKQPKKEHYEAQLDELEQAHNDWLEHELVVSGFNKAKVKKFLETDYRAKRYMADIMGPRLRELNVTLDQWLDRRIRYLRELTGDDPQLLNAIATGRFLDERLDKTPGPDIMPDGRYASLIYNDGVHKASLLNAEIKELSRMPRLDAEASLRLRVLQVERLRTLKEMNRLRRQYGETGVGETGRVIKMGDRKRAADFLEERWQSGRGELPDTLLIRKSPNSVRGLGMLEDLRRWSHAANEALYKPFKMLTWVDNKGTRGSLFAQAYNRNKFEYLRRGYSEAEATGLARARAASITKDLMYDLTARTSVQRALKDLFWFAPATQEVLYTWLVKIPSASYWPVGASALFAKGSAGLALLRETGIVTKDANGDDVIRIPGLSTFLERASGGYLKVPDITFGKLEGINIVTTGGGVPGLGTPANFALGQAAIHFGGPFKELSDRFQPYGPETSLMPAPINYGWEMLTGEAPPWEGMFGDYVKAQWDRSFDHGIQYAFAELQAEGELPPLPEDFGKKNEDGSWTVSPDQEKAYLAANEAYYNKLFALGERYGRGQAAVRLMGSTVAPMSLFSTTEQREQWEKFWNNSIVPEGFGSQGLSEAQTELIDGYVGDHPLSFAFTVFEKARGEKTRDLAFKEELDDNFYDEFLTGESETMEPEDFADKIMAIQSLRFFQNEQDTQLDKISPERDPWVLLVNGAARSDIMTETRERWDRYLYLNPDADALLKKQRLLWAAEKNVPVRSFEADRLSTVSQILSEISPMLTGENNLRSTELRTLMSDVKQLFSETGEFGEANTKAEKATDWWFNNVMEPYIDQTEPLRLAADDAEARGLSASPYWNEIRQLSNGQPLKYKGQKVPTVEEVFFGNRNEDERVAATLKWQTQPLAWLSNFRLDTAGYDLNPKARDFLNDVANFDQKFYENINKYGLTPGSDAYDRYESYRRETLLKEAHERGPKAVEAWRLNESTPFARLDYADYGSDSASWSQTGEAASNIAQQLRAAELSPKGTSEDAVRLKSWLYQQIETMRDTDKSYDELWTNLSDITLLPDGTPREGSALYEAILFSNYRTQDLPYSLASIGA